MPNPFQFAPVIKPLEDMDEELGKNSPLIYIQEVKDFLLLSRELEKRTGKTSLSRLLETK